MDGGGDVIENLPLGLQVVALKRPGEHELPVVSRKNAISMHAPLLHFLERGEGREPTNQWKDSALSNAALLPNPMLSVASTIEPIFPNGLMTGMSSLTLCAVS